MKRLTRKAKTILTTAVAAIVSVSSTLALCLPAPFETDDGDVWVPPYVEVENAVEDGDVLAMPDTFSFTSTSLIKAMGATVGETGTTGTVSVTLTATVEPADAYNKEVDWSAVWKDGATLQNENVENYVTVVPTADGSTTATVTCWQPFVDNTVKITVTTREGGYTSTCDVEFIGIPTSMQIVPMGNYARELSVLNGEEAFGDDVWHYYLSTETTYQFEVLLDNPFHQVSEQYYEDVYVRLYQESAAQDMYGCWQKMPGSDGGGKVYGTSARWGVTLGDLLPYSLGEGAWTGDGYWEKSLQNHLFVITPKYTYTKTVMSGSPLCKNEYEDIYYQSFTPLRWESSDFYEGYFFEAVLDQANLIQYFGVEIVERVTGVNLDNTNVRV